MEKYTGCPKNRGDLWQMVTKGHWVELEWKVGSFIRNSRKFEAPKLWYFVKKKCGKWRLKGAYPRHATFWDFQRGKRMIIFKVRDLARGRIKREEKLKIYFIRVWILLIEVLIWLNIILNWLAIVQINVHKNSEVNDELLATFNLVGLYQTKYYIS